MNSKRSNAFQLSFSIAPFLWPVVFTAFLTFVPILHAMDEYLVRGFYPSDGLAYEVVRDIKQTPDGAIWFATWGGGISRLDRTEWISYSITNGLPANDIRSLFVDSMDRLWCGTTIGIACFDGSQWQTVPIPLPDLTLPSVFCFEEISPGQLWIGTDSGHILEYRFPVDRRGKTDGFISPSAEESHWSIVLDSDISNGNGVRDILPLESGEIYVAISLLGVIDYQHGTCEILVREDDVRSLSSSHDGSIWATGSQYCHQYQNGNWRKIPEINEASYCIAEIKKGLMALGTSEGLFFLQNGYKRIVNFSQTVPHPYIECITCLDDGVVWVGTRFGAYRIWESSWKLHEKSVDGVPLNGSVFYADPETPPFLVDDSGRFVRLIDNLWKPCQTLTSNPVSPLSVAKPFQGTSWILVGNQAVRIDLNNNEVIARMPVPSDIEVNQIYQANSGNLYLYGQSGLYIFSEDSWRSYESEDGPVQRYIRVMEESRDGTLWIGFDETLECLNNHQQTVFERLNRFGGRLPLRVIYQSRNDDMWFGCFGGGLIHSDGQIIHNYTAAEGLVSDRVTAIFEAGNGTIWIGSYMMGVSAFRDGRLIAYTRDDGLNNDKINAIGEYPEGTIWIAESNTGVYSFRHSAEAPDTFIRKSPSRIAPNGRGVFHFSGIDAWKKTKSSELVYSWRIVSGKSAAENSAWSPYSPGQVVVSPLLDGGKYTFEVRAADKDFNTDPLPAAVDFEVLPGFWWRRDVWGLTAFLLSLAFIAGWFGWKKQIALISSEKKNRELVESIHEAIYTTDAKGVVTYISPGVTEMCGFSPSELTGHPFMDFVFEQDRSRMYDNFQKILHGETKSGEYRFISKEGKKIWILTSSHPLLENGIIIGLSGIATNINDRKIAEEELQQAYELLEQRVHERTVDLLKANTALREEIVERQRMEGALRNSEERLRQIINNMPVMLDAFDDENRIVFWNKECERVTEYSAEEIIGNPKALELLYPDTTYRQKVIEKIQLLAIDFRNIEFELTCKNGHKRIISWSNISSLFPIPGWTSWSIGIDITRRKRAQDALQKSEIKFRTLFNHASDSIFILDKEGKIREVNEDACQLLQYGRDELCTMNLRDITPPEMRSLISLQMEELDRVERTVYESKHVAKDGTIIPVEVSVRTIEFKSQSAILNICRNITIRKKLEEERIRIEEQFRQSQKMEAIGQLAGGVAHDFNNLLHVILGYTQMAMVGFSSDEKSYQYMEKARTAAERSADLTRQLLAFSRRQTLEPKYINVNKLAEQLVTMLSRIIGEDIDVRLNLEPELNTVYADPGMMEQVVMNLCVNARDAMPQGGQLNIATENADISPGFCQENPWAREGRYVCLLVADTGIGMTPDVLDRIFEPFYTTKEQGKGTGLGLSTVYGSIKQHDGFVHVTSTPGNGTVFAVYIPSVEKPSLDLPSTEPGGIVKGTETILLAEDESMVRELAVQVLQENGYSVLIAKDGDEALRVYQENAQSIDLLLLDFIMPKMNGRDAFNRISADGRNVKVLFSSGYGAEIADFLSPDDEQFPLIKKPYTPTRLLQKVREILDCGI